jgi:hypothetical protein
MISQPVINKRPINKRPINKRPIVTVSRVPTEGKQIISMT